MFIIDFDSQSFTVNVNEGSPERVVKELCTDECLMHFVDKDSDTCDYDVSESDIIEYYLTKENLTSTEEKMLTSYFEYLLEQNCLDSDMLVTCIESNMGYKFAQEFMSRLNPVARKYLLNDIIDSMRGC